jgi:hypothetical protein
VLGRAIIIIVLVIVLAWAIGGLLRQTRRR